MRFRKRDGRLARKISSRQLRVETLEERRLLTISATFAGGLLDVVSADESIVLAANTNGYVTINDNSHQGLLNNLPASSITAIHVQGGDGTQTINLEGVTSDRFSSIADRDEDGNPNVNIDFGHVEDLFGSQSMAMRSSVGGESESDIGQVQGAVAWSVGRATLQPGTFDVSPDTIAGGASFTAQQFADLASSLIGADWAQALGIEDEESFLANDQWQLSLSIPQLTAALDPDNAAAFAQTILGTNWAEELGVADVTELLSSGVVEQLLIPDSAQSSSLHATLSTAGDHALEYVNALNSGPVPVLGSPAWAGIFATAEGQFTSIPSWHVGQAAGAVGQEEMSTGGGGNYAMLSSQSFAHTIIGSAFSDRIWGSSQNDLINGGDGDDEIDALGGDDTVSGDNGNDTIVDGAEGNNSGAGNDTLYGGDGDDVINGGGGADQIYGDAGSDNVNGGEGQQDYVDGGVGDDQIADGGEGSSYLSGSAGDDVLNAGDSAQTFEGGGGDDTFNSYGDNSTYIYAGDEDLGTDTFANAAGGGGATLDFSALDFGVGVHVDLRSDDPHQVIAGTRNGQPVQLTLVGISHISHILGTQNNDTLTAGAAGANLEGQGGDDTLSVPSAGAGISFAVDGGTGTNLLQVTPTANQTNIAMSGSQVSLSNGPTITYANVQSLNVLGGPATVNVSDSLNAILPSLTLAQGSQIAWTFGSLPTDNYDALLTWANGGSTDARFIESADAISTTIDVDQSLASIGANLPWYALGTLPVTGGSLTVSLTNSGIVGAINLNGLKLVRAAGLPSVTSTPILDAASDGGILHDGITNTQLAPTFVGTAEIGDTVRIFSDGTLIGSQIITDGTYRITATSALASGQHIITAQAINGSSQTTSAPAPLLLTIDLATPSAPPPPTLDIRSDTGFSQSDGITNIATPTFVGFAEPGATVQILSDGVVVGSAIAAGGAYSIAVSQLSEGSHTIRARAIDRAGNNSSLSASLSITIDKTAPSTPAAPTLDLGSDSGILDGSTNVVTPVFTGAASGAATVQIFSDGILVGTGAVQSNAYSITVNRLGVGTHSITTKSIDVAGNISSASSATSLVITAAPATPSAAVLDPASDSGSSSSDGVTNVQTPTFVGTADPGTTVQVFSDGVLVGSSVATVQGHYAVSVPTNHALTAGTHVITANTTDVEATTSSYSAGSAITIVLAAATPSAPQLAAISDSGSSDSDGVTNVARPTFVGIAALGSSVQLFVNGSPVASVSASGGTYTITLPANLADGSYVITARTTDIASNISQFSDSRTITINTAVPNAPFAPHQDSQNLNTFTGTAPLGTSVTLYMTSSAPGSHPVRVGSTEVDSNGLYSVTAAGLVNGNLTLVAYAENTLTGSISAASTSTSISFSAPQLTMLDGATTLTTSSIVDLGTTFAGKATLHSFTITNMGSAHLLLDEPLLPAGFSVVTDFGSKDLAPNASTTLTIRLNADAAGLFNGLMVIGSNDGSAVPFSVTLAGQVTAAGIIDDSGAGFTKSLSEN